MKKLLFGCLGLILLLVGGGFVAVQFFLRPEFIGQQIQQAVQSTTGRQLQLNQTPGISYWPKLSIELRDASLSNPSQFEAGTFIKMDAMRVAVDPVALLSRKLQIEEISLEGPDIALLVNEAGQANWSFETAPNGAADGNASGESLSNPISDISLAPIKISNGTITYLDQRAGSEFNSKNVNITISLPDLSSPLKVDGSLNWNERPIALKLSLDDPRGIATTGSGATAVIRSGLFNANFNGEISLQNGFQLAGAVEASSPSIRSMSAWLGNPIAPGNGLGPFAARSQLQMDQNFIQLINSRLSLDGMNAQGTLTADISGPVPFISGSLGVDKIDVNAYLPAVQESNGGQSRSTDWSDERIDFSGLRAVNARLTLNTFGIFYRDVKIGNTKLSAELNDGTLRATLKQMAFYDGSAAGVIGLSAANNTVTGTLNASGLDGGRLLKDFADFDRITGTTSLNLNVNASGNSEKQIVSSLNGAASFKFEDGALKGINIPQMVRSVQKNILGGWQSSPQEKTDFSILQANFTIENGIASNNDLFMASPLMRINGVGLLHMPQQAINYRVEPRVVKSLIGQGGGNDLIGLKVPVIIRGPWADPKIYPDIKGILENPQEAFDALSKLTGGNTSIDIKAEQQKIEQKVNEEIQGAIEKVVPKDTLGEDGQSLIEEQGKSLLKSIFGGGD